MLNKIKEIKEDNDLYETILVASGTLIGAFFSYLLQFFLGRKLSVEDYGSFNAILSLSYLISVPAAVLSISLVKVVSELFVRNDENKIKLLFVRLSVMALIVGFLQSCLFIFLSGRISVTLKINSVTPVILFAILLGFGFLNGIPPSYLQGLQKFKNFSIYYILMCFNRFFGAFVLVMLGFGLNGVFGGMMVSSVVTFIIGTALIGLNLKTFQKSDLSPQYKKLLSFSLPVLFVYFSLTFLSNIDLIMVKKFFTPIEAGYYSGAITLGKILLFGAGAVTTVMFPKITALYSKGVDFYKELKNLLGILISLLVIGVVCYSIFPGIITNVFFGKTFENSVKYLPMFSVFVALYVLVNFFVLFFLAIEKRAVSLILLPMILLQYLLLQQFHSSIYEVIKVDIFVCIMTLVMLILFFTAQRFKWLKSLTTAKN